MSRLLHRSWSTERLVATCFSEVPHIHCRHLYASFSSVCYEGRWGEALKAAQELLPLESSLKAALSLRRFNYGQANPAVASDEEDSDGVRMTNVLGRPSHGGACRRRRARMHALVRGLQLPSTPNRMLGIIMLGLVPSGSSTVSIRAR